MNHTCHCHKAEKKSLKRLREARKNSILELTRMVKEQKKIVAAIMEQLAQGPATVPEIASALRLPASKVLWFIAALKKYGEVAEGEKEGGYFRYEPAAAKAMSGPESKKDENGPD